MEGGFKAILVDEGDEVEGLLKFRRWSFTGSLRWGYTGY